MHKMIPLYQPLIKRRYARSVFKQIMSGWIGPSLKTAVFELEISRLTGAKHIILTTSGTTALILAIASLDLPEHSTILFPSYTNLAGANAARLLGHEICLVDVKVDTLCMNPAELQQAIDKHNPAAIIFVNHNGYVGEDVQVIKALCGEVNIPMIEDSAQALGIRGAGRVGDVGIFSFSVPKIVTTGQGGAVITDNDQIAKRCKQLIDQGGGNWRQTRLHSAIGGNFRFNDILASYGLAQLRNIYDLLKLRERVWKQYGDYISVLSNANSVPTFIAFRSRNPEKVITHLRKEQIQAAQLYTPVHYNSAYEAYSGFPNAEELYRTLVYLPYSLSLKHSEIDRIGREIWLSDV